jgi:carboxymethylenebutenolidase
MSTPEPTPAPAPAEPDRTEPVTVDDGTFDLITWLPDSGSGPGVLLLQEIFGVGAYLRSVATRLRDLGFVVGAPDLYWRDQRGFAADHDEAGMGESFALVVGSDPDKMRADCVASLHALAALPEVQGVPGVLGFCLGGTLAWGVAVDADPAWAVSYYGSGVPDLIDLAPQVTCPVLMHFGDRDDFLPLEGVRRVEGAAEDLELVTVRIHDAGHAFDNHEAPGFHDADASAAAWAETVAFLRAHAGP